MGISNRNLGISSNGFYYQKIRSEQSILIEFKKTVDFILGYIITFFSNIYPNLSSDEITIRFINYGDKELVYAVKAGNKEYVVLIGQPANEMRFVEQEFNNLKSLARISNSVIEPMCYINSGDREAFIAPYIHQAGCIASEEEWGIHTYEPEHHFEPFSNYDRSIIIRSMVALLISMYDRERKLGVANCQIDNGDFILLKEWFNSDHTIERTLSFIKLTTARSLISISLDEYKKILRSELLKAKDNCRNMLVNCGRYLPIDKKDIEVGIDIGYQLYKKQSKLRV